MNVVTRIGVSLCLILPCYGGVYAQRDTTYQVSTSSYLKAAYNSSIVYPGIRAGVEHPFLSKVIHKTKGSGALKEIKRDQLLSINFGWYHHATFHDNLYLTAGYGFRRTRANGFLTELTPELGYSRTFLGGTTYRVDTDGNVSINKGAGNSYALLSLGGGLGYV
jgi:hypothetical protein